MPFLVVQIPKGNGSATLRHTRSQRRVLIASAQPDQSGHRRVCPIGFPCIQNRFDRARNQHVIGIHAKEQLAFTVFDPRVVGPLLAPVLLLDVHHPERGRKREPLDQSFGLVGGAIVHNEPIEPLRILPYQTFEQQAQRMSAIVRGCEYTNIFHLMNDSQHQRFAQGDETQWGEYAYNAAKEKDSRNSQPSIGDEE